LHARVKGELSRRVLWKEQAEAEAGQAQREHPTCRMRWPRVVRPRFDLVSTKKHDLADVVETCQASMMVLQLGSGCGQLTRRYKKPKKVPTWLDL
jgi:hypothetical protein